MIWAAVNATGHFFDIKFTGTISLGSFVTFLTALIGFFTVGRQQRKVHDKVNSIDQSVNGRTGDEQTLRENVQDLHDEQIGGKLKQ